jgi:hypothetical protein
MLAKETGWPEHFIVWELPLVRVLEYYHAALWHSGAWTVAPSASVGQQLDELSSLVDNLTFDDGDT